MDLTLQNKPHTVHHFFTHAIDGPGELKQLGRWLHDASSCIDFGNGALPADILCRKNIKRIHHDRPVQHATFRAL